MTPERIAGLLAEPTRLQTFCAVVLGADSVADIATASGLSPRQSISALRRLEDAGLVERTAAGLRACAELFTDAARAANPPAEIEQHGYADERIEATIRSFVRGGRLIRMPAQLSRRRIVLAHLASASFEAGVHYDEPTVNDRLRIWCEAAEVDHVTVRRYLIDLCILGRQDGSYWLRTNT